MKIVQLPFLPAFWITRVGDWVYLFDHPTGQQIGKGIYSPKERAA